ncbi:MAG: hypothetical protein ABR905_03525 [Terracidiphilus sp.]|jgi:hypothetical protein
MTKNGSEAEGARSASFFRVGLMKAGLWPGLILVLAAFLLVEWEIFDICVHHAAKGLPPELKHLFLPLITPLLIPLAGSQAYLRLKDDLPADGNTPEVLDVVKTEILSLTCMVLVSIVLLLVGLYGN